ncbi:UDP-N-acetylglucosamine--undecaprenyl-phosphate N-acetylglucosaminephosphotransferase [Vibrio crassostreae]|uniref:UDP-N-acetylglucosamine--undecaprenyl-phosphate N-acetylglucosaminephosphotransferase n=1 Tax=Vibrio crassostreae TaxID=246167 RepID=UPI000F4862FA|nr:UDP-N-acetylglucosamine--undecaprenyl-phosphate N-acetylglucosaminephosphotransferase [Vibrio crassostreae]NOH75337.1 UDP-N-acetylglucosamine--undecaprenyl-phosphate N-acetylglucosaminephosphotransferase [Vibrio crassostreae]NOI52921.1 UDP-N-acetylglucosamine--undecaprenyl-phosphate N-acetylglucosaminephosphotransferase [Vibrio crassostreae]ROR09668.1 UDP-GlcNAc:undecaprenyl-phosphate GlcNAc-1-phosphate transferase [Vibrio crassostreae]CAK1796561.1 UDP-N-acetylglucosamine--undecaprenyl-phosp
MIISFLALSFLFFFSFATIFIMRKFAKKIGLVDKPNARKLHDGAIPLVGGLSICISLLYFLFNNPNILPHTELYAACILILVGVGVLDDKYDISFKLRFAVQAGLSIIMMVVGDIELITIGDVFGTGDVITLGWFGFLVTIFAVVGAINAFNMVDGIDGLLGGLSIVTFGGLGIMLYFDGQHNLAYICLVLVVTIVPYILLNLGAFGRKRKVFMGDAGSMLIGFTVIWLLLLSSQNGSKPPLRPVTALWLIAIPLLDMAAIMIRRVRRGDSPFKPDREHLHHIFQRLGLSSTQTLIVISSIASVFAAIGIGAEMLNIPEYVMFYAFVACFVIYLLLLSNIWSITAYIRKNFSKN